MAGAFFWGHMLDKILLIFASVITGAWLVAAIRKKTAISIPDISLSKEISQRADQAKLEALQIESIRTNRKDGDVSEDWNLK